MLELIDIQKSYGKQVVLSSLNITLDKGIYGLLGPNGAGKSTLMNIITNNLRPDRGSVLWNQESIYETDKNYRRILSYTPQQQGLYDEFTGRRFLSYMAALKEITKENLKEEIEKVATYVHLNEELDKRIRAYSGGMKQRLLIAQAFLGNPQLIIMDEPTAGLDPKERIRVRELIQSFEKEKTIIVATHVVSDIETIANEILLLKKGEVIAKGAPTELINEYAPNKTMEDVYLALFGKDA